MSVDLEEVDEDVQAEGMKIELVENWSKASLALFTSSVIKKSINFKAKALRFFPEIQPFW